MRHGFYIFLFLFSFGILNAQLEKLIVETYYVSDQKDSTDHDGGMGLPYGSVTYRVFADLLPGCKLIKIYGDTNHVLRFNSTLPFYNNIDGETFGKDLKKATYQYNTAALDTWLTIGQTTRTQGGKTNFGIRKTQDPDGSFIGGNNNDGGSALIAGGLLTNTAAVVGVSLPTADGMDTMMTVPINWLDYGIKDFFSGQDTSIFGSVKIKSSFKSYNFFLKNSGVRGVIPDSNEVLIAQLTTKGELSFEINLEVEEMIDGIPTIVKYVANDSILKPGEKKNRYLKFPFPPPLCGCKDPNFIEYSPKFECADNQQFCIHPIVFGCMDTMACNYDPNANVQLPGLCCYPGLCSGRDIAAVCPEVKGNSFTCDIFPNPAQETLYLTISSGVSAEIDYTIYNYFGTPVVTNNFGATDRISAHPIDLTNLTHGLYLIRVNIGNQSVKKQFFRN